MDPIASILGAIAPAIPGSISAAACASDANCRQGLKYDQFAINTAYQAPSESTTRQFAKQATTLIIVLVGVALIGFLGFAYLLSNDNNQTPKQ
jgi:plastocyanin domain-containing protein